MQLIIGEEGLRYGLEVRVLCPNIAKVFFPRYGLDMCPCSEINIVTLQHCNTVQGSFSYLRYGLEVRSLSLGPLKSQGEVESFKNKERIMFTQLQDIRRKPEKLKHVWNKMNFHDPFIGVDILSEEKASDMDQWLGFGMYFAPSLLSKALRFPGVLRLRFPLLSREGRDVKLAPLSVLHLWKIKRKVQYHYRTPFHLVIIMLGLGSICSTPCGNTTGFRPHHGSP